VPKSLGSCSKLCALLLLVELLRLRRPDLRPVEPESLISLVGSSRRSPVPADAKPAAAFVRENLLLLPPRERPKDQLELFMDALQELNRGRADPVQRESRLTDEDVRTRFSRQGLIAIPLPGFAPGSERPSKMSRLPLGLPFGRIARFFGDPETVEPICRFVGAMFLASLVKESTSPRIRAAATIAAAGCAIGVSRGT